MKKLISVVEQYRLDTEEEATHFIEECKEDAEKHGYTLKSYSSTKKEKKAKGEIIDEAVLVKLAKDYDTFWDQRGELKWLIILNL